MEKDIDGINQNVENDTTLSTKNKSLMTTISSKKTPKILII